MYIYIHVTDKSDIFFFVFFFLNVPRLQGLWPSRLKKRSESHNVAPAIRQHTSAYVSIRQHARDNAESAI